MKVDTPRKSKCHLLRKTFGENLDGVSSNMERNVAEAYTESILKQARNISQSQTGSILVETNVVVVCQFKHRTRVFC